MEKTKIPIILVLISVIISLLSCCVVISFLKNFVEEQSVLHEKSENFNQNYINDSLIKLKNAIDNKEINIYITGDIEEIKMSINYLQNDINKLKNSLNTIDQALFNSSICIDGK